MRYSKQSLQFWATVKNLFRGKGVNFFRGYKAQGQGSDVRPEDCRINFVVPSDPVLAKESAKFIEDARQPGILRTPLQCFSQEHKGKDVKISIDGKKLASGLGALGDENLCGHEADPSLNERKLRHSSEIESVNEVRDSVQEQSLGGCERTKDVSNSKHMKHVLLIIITNLSKRVKELRGLILKKNLALNTLLKQVDGGDWKTSKVAPAISFCKTKIVHSKTTICELLQSIDSLGFVVAQINGTEKDYILGMHTKVHLGEQQNYECLRDGNTTEEPRFTKQRSSEWFELRRKSRITGSTMFKALGLGLLREQQEHYDKVYLGKEKAVTPSLQELFDYGTKNEINALATLVGKIIPVYYPHLRFVEDGCEVIPVGDATAVISGDGSGMNSDNLCEVAFEFKCPKPGKTRTTDVHYDIPRYYTTQVLSQMAVKSCDLFSYISYTPESSTFITGAHDSTLWSKLHKTATDMYGSSSASRPVRAPAHRIEVLGLLQEYASSCNFVAEFPSLIGINCTCPSCDEYDSTLSVYGKHTRTQTEESSEAHSLEMVAATLEASASALNEAYEILRRPAKEILVTVLSDIDRTITSNDITCHATPIHYAMAGYSLPMVAVRGILKDLFKEITNVGLELRVIAFDGQFLEIAVAGESGRPLTICRFMKQSWNDVQKIDKQTKISALLDVNHMPSIVTQEDLTNNFNIQKNLGGGIRISSKEGMRTVVPSPQNITMANVSKKHTKEKHVNEPEHVDIMEFIPPDIIEKLDEETVIMLQRVQAVSNVGDVGDEQCSETSKIDHGKDHTLEEEEIVDQNQETDYETPLIALIASKEHSRWTSISIQEFRELFKKASTINASFTVAELKVILSIVSDVKNVSKMLKPHLVNLVSTHYGDGSTLSVVSSPKTLKVQCVKAVKKWNIQAVNVAYAQCHFPAALSKWEEKNTFQGEWTIETESGNTFRITKWYAQPSHMDELAFQPIIDPHHIFVNNRVRCCSKGMERMKVSSTDWWKVAEHSKENGTGLSLEIAKDLRDRQRNSFAQTTFSELVEKEMIRIGRHCEAGWCRLIRNWYRAIDEAGVDVDQRIQWMMEMRDHLLQFLKVGHFPPPGGFVADLPMAQFEGILSNVDRRLQLYTMITGTTYNQRAVTSLDSETFFSAFQDYDPKGTGILRPDDVPIALGAAVSLFNQRMDSKRGFYMKTSTKQRVYPENTQPAPAQPMDGIVHQMPQTNHILVRNHHFDKQERKSKNPKRKSGKISTFGSCGKGAEGVRAHHKLNEEKILPHRRFGLSDKDLE